MNQDDLKPGTEVYCIDKSEGLGHIEFIRGTVRNLTDSSILLDVESSGVLSAPGYEPLFDVAPPKVGDILTVDADETHLILSPEEFRNYRRDVERLPTTSVTPSEKMETGLSLNQLIEEREKQRGKKQQELAREQEEEEKQEEERQLSIPVEEGTPEFESDLEKIASLASTTRDIEWPRGFSPKEQHWMEEIYESLPSGTSETTPEGEPVVAIPGGKGPGVPPDFSEVVRLREREETIGKEVKTVTDRLQEAEQLLSKADPESEEAKQLQKKVKGYTAALSQVKDTYLKVRRQLAEVLYQSRPEGESFTQVPGNHAPRGEQRGKAGLRVELRQLANNYANVSKLVETLHDKEEQVQKGQEEINLLLEYGKQKLRESYGLSGGPSLDKILDRLQKLKYDEFKRLPYFWDEKERSSALEMQEHAETPGRDDPAEVFQEYAGKGNKRTFFDLTPEELAILSKQIAETSPLSVKDVESRVQKFAEDYKQFVKSRMNWGSLGTEIQKYLKDKHGLSISSEVANQLARRVRDKGAILNVEGLNEDGQEVKVKVPTGELRKQVSQFTEDFKNRIKWLKRLEDGRKLNLSREKARIRKEYKGDEKLWKEAIVRLFRKYEKEAGSNITPGKHRLFQGYKPTEDKIKQLDAKRSEEKALEAEISKLEQERSALYDKPDATEELRANREQIEQLIDKLKPITDERYKLEEELR